MEGGLEPNSVYLNERKTYNFTPTSPQWHAMGQKARDVYVTIDTALRCYSWKIQTISLTRVSAMWRPVSTIMADMTLQHCRFPTKRRNLGLELIFQFILLTFTLVK